MTSVSEEWAASIFRNVPQNSDTPTILQGTQNPDDHNWQPLSNLLNYNRLTEFPNLSDFLKNEQFACLNRNTYHLFGTTKDVLLMELD
jgi:hypothetical protein